MRRLLLLIIAMALTIALALGVIWRTPVFLPQLTEAAPAIPVGDQRVFGYATLTNPLVRSVVAGRWLPGEAVVLPGFERVGRHLVEAPETRVPGIVFTVDPAALERIDRYERAGERYMRRLKTLADGSEAWVYRLIDGESAR
ncbi:gamma-glutamylcyclotransferase family protein [Pararhodobacter sp. SW119]|uniref:gamma-glutamylcyclotransferase family protein n=1 Tax=Pararhodobacter sp. SW119 TaxID=2780075 RepID=UPI001AE085EA|nr:gamma-glutamylcyclotransferase family protein [Pararhodobacter sp. SW119]